jgi:hypothetical protein
VCQGTRSTGTPFCTMSCGSMDDIKGVPVECGKRSNQSRSNDEWLAIIALWKHFRLEFTCEARSSYFKANPGHKEIIADKIYGASVEHFIAALQNGYKGGLEVQPAKCEGLERKSLRKKIEMDRLQLIQPGFSGNISVAERLVTLNEALSIRSNKQGVIPKVEVIYDEAAAYLGYQLAAKQEALSVGDVVGYYAGDCLPSHEFNEFLRDPEYAMDCGKNAPTYWGPGPKMSIDAIRPYSCFARYINCTMDPESLENNVKVVRVPAASDQHFKLRVVVTREIAPGARLQLYYSLEYWGTRLSMMSKKDPRRLKFYDQLLAIQDIELGIHGRLKLPNESSDEEDEEYTGTETKKSGKKSKVAAKAGKAMKAKQMKK